MVSRRELLKGGLGLAGILASRQCPAFVKGLVAAANTSLLEVTAGPNPYVSNGLIAMWDGDWNAGWDEHDSTATVWKDLVGGYDLTGQITGNSKWRDNSMYFQGNQSPPTYFRLDTTEKSNELSNAAKSFCITFKADPVRGNGQTIVMPNANQSLIICPVKQGSITLGYGGSRARSFTDTNYWHFFYYEYNKSSVVIDNVAYSLDLWGEQLKGSVLCIGGTGLGYQGFDGTIGNIKMYSRGLTSAEVAKNYGIDKERFGI